MMCDSWSRKGLGFFVGQHRYIVSMASHKIKTNRPRFETRKIYIESFIVNTEIPNSIYFSLYFTNSIYYVGMRKYWVSIN